MSMTMTGIDHTAEIDPIAETDHEIITKMTIEKKNYWEIQNWKHRSRYRDYYGDTCYDRYIDNCRNTYKDSYRDKYRDKYRDDSFDSDRGRSREKHCLHNAREDNVLLVTIQGLNNCTRSYNS